MFSRLQPRQIVDELPHAMRHLLGSFDDEVIRPPLSLQCTVAVCSLPHHH